MALPSQPRSWVADLAPRRWLAAAALALAVVGAAMPAEAAGREAVRVLVHAPDGCATDRDFFDAVRTRTRHVLLAAAADDETAYTLRVSIVATPHLVQADLLVVTPAGETTRRTLAADTCDAVVASLGWIAARAIDPDASLTPLPEPSTPDPGPSAAEPATPPPAPPLFPCAPLPPRAEAPPVLPPPPHAPEWRITGFATASILGVGDPGGVLDVGVGGELALDSRRLISPALRLSVHHTTDAEAQATGASGSFAWTFARLEACPWRFGVVAPVALRACTVIDAGVLAASGGATGNGQPTSELRPWATAGELARLEWNVSRAIRVDAEGGVLLPLVRERFQLDPSVRLYQAPAVLGFAGVGLGVRFP